MLPSLGTYSIIHAWSAITSITVFGRRVGLGDHNDFDTALDSNFHEQFDNRSLIRTGEALKKIDVGILPVGGEDEIFLAGSRVRVEISNIGVA